MTDYWLKLSKIEFKLKDRYTRVKDRKAEAEHDVHVREYADAVLEYNKEIDSVLPERKKGVISRGSLCTK